MSFHLIIFGDITLTVNTVSFTDLDCCYQDGYFESILTTLKAKLIFK
jgi:hypothetical protein